MTNAFRHIRSQDVASLKVRVEEYEHIRTGAQHIHLSPQAEGDSENVFLVALRTVPHDNTGVAHILEHTALCGSQRYPVRDPFFMMTRRSINTFMNAFTSSDWTAYPFASLNKKDFNNLLDVYLDAVFFSRLDALDFAQEGHRLEFSRPDDKSSPLEFKGVVFNEMKGAMSSVPSQLWHTLCKYLFPNTTYHYNSGGDPEAIPDLSYDQLQAFYKTHYHPSNAIFMTYGDIAADTHQAVFEEKALQHFDCLDETISVPDEKRYCAPIRIQEHYPNSDEDIDNKTHVVIAWLLGKSTNLQDALRAELLSSVLLDNSACPLMQVLETTDLGSAPSPLCGLDNSQKELSFLCGLSGCSEDSADAVESLVFETLEKIAQEGVPQADVEAALHQLELHQREVGGDSYPYGLQLILTALTTATHRGDPVGLLNIDGELDSLREEIKNPEFIKHLAKTWLLDNQHRVRLTMIPDRELADRKDAAEKNLLEEIKSRLSESEQNAIISQAAALKERQAKEDDESLLPRVELSDVPAEDQHVEGETHTISGTKITRYDAGTNGLVYQQVICPLPALSDEQCGGLNFYGRVMSELGAGDKNYLDMQRLQASVAGSLIGYASIRPDPLDVHQSRGFFVVSGKALKRNQTELSEVMATVIHKTRFDEHERITDLLMQLRQQQEQSLTGNGHVLAMSAATAGVCAVAALHHKLTGLAGIQHLKNLASKFNEENVRESLAETLAGIHHTIFSMPRELLLVGEQEHLDEYLAGLAPLCAQPKSADASLQLRSSVSNVKEAWLTNTQVNFCAKVYPTVPMGHEDAAALTALGAFLRNGFLHTAVREQGGAYGGGASQDSNLGAFRFYSYRDPRLSGTLDDFDKAIEWLQDGKHSQLKLEEAILSTVSSLDRSESPAGRAKRCFHSALHGRTRERRLKFRQQLLATTLDDLRRVAKTYLVTENANVAVVCPSGSQSEVEALGLSIKEV